MAKKNGYCNTGKSAATFAARNSEKAIVGLGRAVADHLGRGEGIHDDCRHGVRAELLIRTYTNLGPDIGDSSGRSA